MSKGNYTVVLTTTTVHTFEIDEVNSSEEAISVAEGLLEEGETGTITLQEVVTWDAYPQEEGEEDEG